MHGAGVRGDEKGHLLAQKRQFLEAKLAAQVGQRNAGQPCRLGPEPGLARAAQEHRDQAPADELPGQTGEKGRPGGTGAASKINSNEHTTGSERIARASARYGERFGANVGFLIYAALVLGALGGELS